MHTHEQALVVHFKAAVSKLLNVTHFPVQILQNSGVSCAAFALKGRKTSGQLADHHGTS